MGSKTAARRAAVRAGVPGRAGHRAAAGGGSARCRHRRGSRPRSAIRCSVKAVAGGGGKGMRVVADAADLSGAIRAARSEAQRAFGDAAVYLERRLIRPRHIEVQLLGDAHGTVLPFVERECSIQRRHQKVVEETPSLAVSPALRERMTSAAAASVARAVGYTNAGTIEFLLDEDGRVLLPRDEHAAAGRASDHRDGAPGIDLVRWQIRIARGERLDLDPAAACAPTGTPSNAASTPRTPTTTSCRRPAASSTLRVPAGPGVRDDSGAMAGLDVPIFYDPLISKLVAWAEDRPRAIARMRRALSEYRVAGIRTTVPFHVAARAGGVRRRPRPHRVS